MKKLVLLVFLLNPAISVASSAEIAHLLEFIEQSGCSFERNGSQYDSREAREHIQKKYDYLEDRIESTEEFIRHAATKSSMSGRPYHVTCDGKKITTANWLSSELASFRSR